MSVELVATKAAIKVAEHLAKVLAEGAQTSSRRLLRRHNRRQKSTGVEERIAAALETHLDEHVKWSEEVQILGMSSAVPTDRVTLQLDLTRIPRRFRTVYPDNTTPSERIEFKEKDLLQGKKSYFLLGDPGAGKTTALKHLFRILLSSRKKIGRGSSTPIVVVLRQFPQAETIPELVFAALGLTRADVGIEYEAPTDRESFDSLRKAELRATAGILDSCNAVLFLDGLDEVPEGVKAQLYYSIEALGNILKNSKIIVSCRSGEYSRLLVGFDVVEVCPLDEVQVRSIVYRWLSAADAEMFLAELEDGPPLELSNRPLFLCQMLAIFDNNKSIPELPSDLCRQMVRLTLQDWDHQRGVARKSRYSRFDVDRRLNFLSYLSYVLTFELQRKRFSRAELEVAYERVRGRFRLPASEGQLVAGEIETHTGILVLVGYDYHEFSHLSIQEYLAAEYIVRLPTTDDLGDLFKTSPASMAVAVSMSSHPSQFLRKLLETQIPATLDVARPYNQYKSDMSVPVERIPAVDSFTSRLVQQRPALEAGLHLGLAAAYLVQASRPPYGHLIRFLEYPNVSTSLVALLDPNHLPGNLTIWPQIVPLGGMSFEMPTEALVYAMLANCQEFPHGINERLLAKSQEEYASAAQHGRRWQHLKRPIGYFPEKIMAEARNQSPQSEPQVSVEDLPTVFIDDYPE